MTGLAWTGADRFLAGEVEFQSLERAGADRDGGTLRVFKEREMLDALVPHLEAGRGGAIVELGVYEGGSTAMLAELLQPRRLIALELTPEPVALLDEFIAARSLHEQVRPYYGVDQADVPRIRQILQDELGAGPLDLVIDDASHNFRETLVSFDALFPRVRPGGMYVIEDWSGKLMFGGAVVDALADGNATVLDWVENEAGTDQSHEGEVVRGIVAARERDPDRPMRAVVRDVAREVDYRGPEAVILALVLASAVFGGAVAEVVTTPWFVAVRRGPQPLDPVEFRLADLVRDPYGVLDDGSWAGLQRGSTT
jgi:predicted O-methyltransferase YrrM